MRFLTLVGCSERKEAYKAAGQDENKVWFALKNGEEGNLGMQRMN